MTTSPTPGSEPLPATYGGSNWRSRKGSHAEDVAAGRLWHRCGTTDEFSPLREVMLAWPPDSIAHAAPPDAYLFLERVDLSTLRRQFAAVRAFYESQGVEVHVLQSPPNASPNILFQRDLYFVTGEGAALARMASPQRAGEERLAAAALAAAGIPILASPRAEATFEGADALWLNRSTVAVGVGRRTNNEGFAQLALLLAPMGVKLILVPLPEGLQHLLGAVNIIDRDLAAVDSERTTPLMRSLLESHGYELLELGPAPEVRDGRALNFVTLAPRKLVMPAGCPAARATLAAHGVRCHELDVSQYLRAAGALGCLTGILLRAE
ncbi:MAG: amidinotransferase [Candidatus Wallbacteria bacterium]|nr:amidinotransferase [Candidatus Wallbacteria bacterium]